MVELHDELMARIEALKKVRDVAPAPLERSDQQATASHDITPHRTETFAALMRGKLDYGNGQIRRSYLKLVDRHIEADYERIRITTGKVSLANVVVSQSIDASIASTFFVPLQTWVTDRSGHMGDTFSFTGGGVDAVEGMFSHGRTPTVCVPAS